METMTQEEKQKLILNHELEMMRMEHHYKMKKMELEHQQKLKERQHKLDMMKIRGGWLGKLFGCN